VITPRQKEWGKAQRKNDRGDTLKSTTKKGRKGGKEMKNMKTVGGETKRKCRKRQLTSREFLVQGKPAQKNKAQQMLEGAWEHGK